MRVHPRRAWCRGSTLGVLSKQGVLHACHPGEMPRNRLFPCLLLPFATLTLLPCLVCLYLKTCSLHWAAHSLVNGVGAVGDSLAIYLLLRGVPVRGSVRNQG